jgi:hypothetical protein
MRLILSELRLFRRDLTRAMRHQIAIPRIIAAMRA